MSRSIIELALKVLKRGTSLTYQDELTEREQAIKGLEGMLKREWVGLTVNEAREFYESDLSREDLIYKMDEFLEEKNQ